MGISVDTDKAICTRCGQAYGSWRSNFPVTYASQYKGVGHLTVCKSCVDSIFESFLEECGDQSLAARQTCRKLDLYWNEHVFKLVLQKNSNRTLMAQYIQKTNSNAYVGKCYDDTLIEEGSMWSFGGTPDPNISDEVVKFWGPGYTSDMYNQLEQRRDYWMSKLPDDFDMDIGTEAIIRQICSLELDIIRDRAAGRSIEKSVSALNNLLGSMNLKPVQKKQEDTDASLANTPMGVWLYRYEKKRPLPEIDDDLKDVNKIRRYVFTWLGHVCKMLGIKNAYAKLYEDEVNRLRVEHPEYDGEDDETFLMDLMTDGDDST